jgi:hypothetical protein
MVSEPADAPQDTAVVNEGDSQVITEPTIDNIHQLTLGKHHDESSRIYFPKYFGWYTCDAVMRYVVDKRASGVTTSCYEMCPEYEKALPQRDVAHTRALYAGEASGMAGIITGQPPILGRVVGHAWYMCNTVHPALPRRVVDTSYRGGGPNSNSTLDNTHILYRLKLPLCSRCLEEKSNNTQAKWMFYSVHTKQYEPTTPEAHRSTRNKFREQYRWEGMWEDVAARKASRNNADAQAEQQGNGGDG